LKKLLILFLLSSFVSAADWQTYRCLVKSQISSGDFSTELLSTIACKKSGSESWTRSTQVKPENNRTITVIKGKTRTTYFPERNFAYTNTEPAELNASLLEDLFKDALQGGLSSGGKVEFNVPASSPLKAIGASKITCWRKSSGITTLDSLVIIDSTAAVSGTVMLVQGITGEDGRSYPLPQRFTYRNAHSGITVNTLFSGYRVNEPMPDETFEITDEK